MKEARKLTRQWTSGGPQGGGPRFLRRPPCAVDCSSGEVAVPLWPRIAREQFRRAWTTFLAVLLAARSSRSTPLEPEGRDVVEGESLRLSCNFNPALASRNLLYFWFRTNRHGKENAAISGSALDPHYSVEYNPAEGRYALLISRAQYDKDNGHYECKLKESGSGADVHNAAYDVTGAHRAGRASHHAVQPDGTRGRAPGADLRQRGWQSGPRRRVVPRRRTAAVGVDPGRSPRPAHGRGADADPRT
ncbi:hypothetical protein MRX96_012250 [Rhipicephalus microplus]